MQPNRNVNIGNNIKPDSKKKAKKYGVGNLAVGPNREPLQVTVMTVPSPSKMDGSTYRYTLKDMSGKREIIALACGGTRLPINQILQVNGSYEIIPGGANAVKRRRDPKFKSEVRNSKTLFLNVPSKIIPLVQNQASVQSPGTSSNAHRNRKKSSASAVNLDAFQNFLHELEKQKGFLIRTFTDVQILNGNVRRYIGCETCTKTTRYSEGETYYCDNKIFKNHKKSVNRKICYVIKGIKIKKSETEFPFEWDCFNETAKMILGKEAFEFAHDLEAQNLFDENIDKNLYTLEVRGKLKEGKPPFPSMIIRTAAPEPKAITTASTVGVNNVSGTYIMATKIPPFDYATLAENFRVLVNKDTRQRPPIGPNEHRYELNSRPAGRALIINNVHFPAVHQTRFGAEKDVVRMQDLLSQLNYTVQVEEDVKSTNLESIIQDFQTKLRDGDVSSSFVVVMSHGMSAEIEMSDGINVNAYSEIIYKFSTDVLPEFESKPKIFVFQSCQNFGPTHTKNTFKQMALSDILVLWPNSPGFLTPRNRKYGSPFIFCLAKILMEQACNTDLTKMCQNVQEAFRGGGPWPTNCKQLPYHISFLFSKNFYFNID